MGRHTICRALVQLSRSQDAQERDEVAALAHRLGRQKSFAPGRDRRHAWEGGSEAKEVAALKERLREDRQSLERLRRQISRPGRARAHSGTSGCKAAPVSLIEKLWGTGDDADELIEPRELCNHRSSFLGREEAALREREQCLEVERTLHLKRLQRLQVAENSTFRDYPLLADRYQLLNMIGRGGFSEVFRAYDLVGNHFCAVKIHELGKDMTDHQKQGYIRRAMREVDIQRALKHPRVVTLANCFPISSRAFGTVLELCEGCTLEEHMKRHGPLPEREARGIVIQILSGLKYMNTCDRKIIHYDLKPGNLFFNCGEIKIADFGLSKVVNEGNGGTIDLTSQGAGTYWYLPPECFATPHGEPPKISSKVDVWSTGVIFFELLFGRRPFGHGISQEALLRAAVAGVAFEAEIPAAPRISPDAREFLRRLLTLDREARPDVLEAFDDPYLRPPRAARPQPRQAGVAPAAVPMGGAVSTGSA